MELTFARVYPTAAAEVRCEC